MVVLNRQRRLLELRRLPTKINLRGGGSLIGEGALIIWRELNLIITVNIFQQISCFTSTTKALLGNLTEIPVRNTCYCFQILTNFIVFAKKKITSQPEIDCMGTYYVLNTHIYNTLHTYRAKQGQIQLYTTIHSYTGLNRAIQSYTQLYRAIHSYT